MYDTIHLLNFLVYIPSYTQTNGRKRFFINRDRFKNISLSAGVGMGFAVVFSRVGTMLAPYILLLGHFSPVIFGVSALISGVCALLLPETLGKQMPETLQDAEKHKLCLPFSK